MADPVLGHAGRKPIAIDVDRLVETRMLLQANSGAGKSWALRRLLEQTHGRCQQVVLDVEGEFYTLRERYDYILARAGKEDRDCPAEPRSAHLLARRLLELGVSAIVDIYELKADDRFAFVERFLRALVEAPKALWHPALVVIDEAHLFCPEKGKPESAAAVIDLMTRGRKRGFAGVLATQRLAKLRKDAAAEANNKLIGRTALDVDMVRAGDELGFPKSERAKLRRLGDGHFFAFGPALSPTVVELKVGRVLTTHPRPGQGVTPTPPARAKIRSVLGQLEDLPAEAEEEARTIEDLTRKNRALQVQIRKAEATARSAAPDASALERARAEGARTAEAVLRKVLERVNARGPRLVRHLETALVELGKAQDVAREPIDVEMPEVSAAAHKIGARGRVQTSARPTPAPGFRTPTQIEPAEGQTGPEQRILDAIAWLESIGNAEPQQVAVAFLAGYKYGAGAYNNPRGSLRAKGLVEYLPGQQIRLTDAGRELARAPEAPLTTAELHERVLARLPGPEQRVLRPLLGAYPAAMAKGELARAAGYTPGAGAFNNPCGRLRSLGLVQYPEPGRVVAMPVLFLEVG